jgi:anti-sigma factor RsiW
MNCDTVRKLLDAYLDGELDLVSSLDIENHLPDCPDCSARLQNRRALGQAMKSDALYFKAPPELGARLRASLPDGKRANRRWNLNQHIWLNLAAAFVAGVLLTVGMFQFMSPGAKLDNTTQQVLASHIRSLMVDHLSDVVSTDQHTVKPWFDGKLDFSPPVIDLKEQGFPLLGGRLDYVDNRPVTALVYGRQKHIINLFIWPSNQSSPSEATTIQGYHLIHLEAANTTYWAVSDLEMTELQAFTQLVQAGVSKTVSYGDS